MEIVDAQIHATHRGLEQSIAIMDAMGVSAAVLDDWPAFCRLLQGVAHALAGELLALDVLAVDDGSAQPFAIEAIDETRFTLFQCETQQRFKFRIALLISVCING